MQITTVKDWKCSIDIIHYSRVFINDKIYDWCLKIKEFFKKHKYFLWIMDSMRVHTLFILARSIKKNAVV